MAESISLITKYIDLYDCCNPSARLPDLYVKAQRLNTGYIYIYIYIYIHIYPCTFSLLSFFCFLLLMMFDVRLDVNDWVPGQSPPTG